MFLPGVQYVALPVGENGWLVILKDLDVDCQ